MPAAETVVAALFLIAATGAFVMTRVNSGIALIWPANAVASALLIRLSKVRWLSAGILLFAANVAANTFVAHRGLPVSIVFSCLNGAEIALTVWVFRSLARFPYPQISIGQATILTAVFGIAIPGLIAISAGGALHIILGISIMQGTLQWWASHAVGACLFAPPIILGSSKSLRRLVSGKFIAENTAVLVVILLGCWVAIRYVHFPFVVIGLLLLMAAFRVGGFGASLLGLCSGLTVATLWSIGVRPQGLEQASMGTSLAELPVVALLAMTMSPIAVGLGTDARRASVRQLKLSEQRFRESMEHSPIGMLIANLNGTWGYTNLALQTMLGYSFEEFRAMPPGGPSDPEDLASRKARLSRLLSGQIESYEVERRFRHKDGRWVWTRMAVSLARDDDGAPLYQIAQIESIEARRRAEDRLADERERLRVTLNSITDAVITLDVDTRITYINAAGLRLLGQQFDDLEHHRLSEVISLTQPNSSRAAVDLVAKV